MTKTMKKNKFHSCDPQISFFLSINAVYFRQQMFPFPSVTVSGESRSLDPSSASRRSASSRRMMRSGGMRAALVFASISPQIGPSEAEMRSRLPPVPPFPPHPSSLPPPDALTPPSSLALLSLTAAEKSAASKKEKRKKFGCDAGSL